MEVSWLFPLGVGFLVGALLAANSSAAYKFFDVDEFWAGVARGMGREKRKK